MKAKKQPLFPSSELPEGSGLSREEKRQRVVVLEGLLEVESLQKELRVARKFLLERLNQVVERN